MPIRPQWQKRKAWIYCKNYVCFQASDGSDFRLEKEITQYLWENSKTCHYTISEKEGEGKDSYWVSHDVLEVTGEFLYFRGGRIVMHFYDQKIKGQQDERHHFVVYKSTGLGVKVKKGSQTLSIGFGGRGTIKSIIEIKAKRL